MKMVMLVEKIGRIQIYRISHVRACLISFLNYHLRDPKSSLGLVEALKRVGSLNGLLHNGQVSVR